MTVPSSMQNIQRAVKENFSEQDRKEANLLTRYMNN